MPTAMFDTLKFSKALRDAGVPEKQAEAEAAVLSEVFSINFREVLTKDDLKQAVDFLDTRIRDVELRYNARLDQFKADMREIEQRMSNKIELVKTELSGKIDQTNSKLDQLKTELVAELKLVDSKRSWDTTMLKWMLGVLITFVGGAMIRLFFYSNK